MPLPPYQPLKGQSKLEKAPTPFKDDYQRAECQRKLAAYGLSAAAAADQSPIPSRVERQGRHVEANDLEKIAAGRPLARKRNEVPITLHSSDKTDDAENILLNYVLAGEYALVAQTLQGDPTLALCRGPATDASGQEFIGFSPFQAACYLGDPYMQQLFLTPELLPGSILQQQHSEIVAQKQYGCFEPLFAVYKKYVEYYQTQPSAEDLKKYWIKEVGAAQSTMPAHLLFEFFRFFGVEKQTIATLSERPTAVELASYGAKFSSVMKRSSHFSGDKLNVVLGENCVLTQQYGFSDEPLNPEEMGKECEFLIILSAIRNLQDIELKRQLANADAHYSAQSSLSNRV